MGILNLLMEMERIKEYDEVLTVLFESSSSPA